jgi:hypothetical protein
MTTTTMQRHDAASAVTMTSDDDHNPDHIQTRHRGTTTSTVQIVNSTGMGKPGGLRVGFGMGTGKGMPDHTREPANTRL